MIAFLKKHWRALCLAIAMAPVLGVASANAAALGVVIANTGGKDTLQFQQWQAFRQSVDEKSNGSILLDYLIFGELGSSDSMAEAMTTGRADIGSFGCAGLTQIIPELSVTQLPFLFGGDDEAYYVLDKYLTPIFSNILDKRGLVFLQWSDFSWMDLYARAPVQLPAQLEGQGVRTADNIVGPAYIRALGGNPEILTTRDGAAHSEQIFAAMGSLRNFVSVDQPAYRYFTRTHHAFNCGLIVANKAWFNTLTPAEQGILRSSLIKSDEMRRQSEDEEKKLLGLLPGRNITILNLSAEDYNAWAASGLPLYPEILNMAGGQSTEIYDAIKAGKQDYLRQGHPIDAPLPK